FREAGIDAEVYPATHTGDMPEVDENAETFSGNALLKARALRPQVAPSDWILADDSGLEVDALDGAPGLHSARFAGPAATDAENRAKLLKHLDRFPPSKRGACFVCVLALLGPDHIEKTFEGICSGRIIDKERGEGGFGYDPIFVPDGLDKTFAEISAEEKDRLSHRGVALRKLFEWIRESRT
ncbi:MAG TPA: RdgB/HAM1 family non-canonical purine NTP pyrophosphatase, partial [Opitutales bacterium]|nr:RdgB/HAM1 family non-canonical purine NTP pyrophosphatase [Opitutales bacterium]